MREHSSRRHHSPSRERDLERRKEKSHKSRKNKKSKKSKKHSRRSSSSSSSYESRSSSRRSRTRPPSADSKILITSSENSRTSVVIHKTIDLTDDHVKDALVTIEDDKFESKPFYSTRDREAPKKLSNEKVVIDLANDTIQIPRPIEIKDIDREEVFHPNFIGDPELKAEKWLRKLFNFRRKLNEE